MVPAGRRQREHAPGSILAARITGLLRSNSELTSLVVTSEFRRQLKRYRADQVAADADRAVAGAAEAERIHRLTEEARQRARALLPEVRGPRGRPACGGRALLRGTRSRGALAPDAVRGYASLTPLAQVLRAGRAWTATACRRPARRRDRGRPRAGPGGARSHRRSNFLLLASRRSPRDIRGRWWVGPHRADNRPGPDARDDAHRSPAVSGGGGNASASRTSWWARVKRRPVHAPSRRRSPGTRRWRTSSSSPPSRASTTWRVATATGRRRWPPPSVKAPTTRRKACALSSSGVNLDSEGPEGLATKAV